MFRNTHRKNRFREFCRMVSLNRGNRMQPTYTLSELTTTHATALAKLEYLRGRENIQKNEGPGESHSAPEIPNVIGETEQQSDTTDSMEYLPSAPLPPEISSTQFPLCSNVTQDCQGEIVARSESCTTHEISASHSELHHVSSLDHNADNVEVTKYSLACSICPKTFKTRGGKSKHMQTHKDRRICSICERSYATETGLGNHMLMHSLDNACPECHKIYASTNGLKRHIRLSHGNSIKN